MHVILGVCVIQSGYGNKEAVLEILYVKSRPVPEKIWNKFLLTTNLVSFWNYVLPVLTLPVFIYLLPASEAVASFFLFLGFSFVNGIYITCYRKATEWTLCW